MEFQAYRGTVLQPDDGGDEGGQPQHVADGFRQIDDAVVVVDDEGLVSDFRTAGRIFADFAAGRVPRNGTPLSVDGDKLLFNGRPLEPTQQVVLPPTADMHDHAFQPPGVPGELLRFVGDGKPPVGWLPDTLRMGELVAKQDIERASAMARDRMNRFALNGVGIVLEYTTSSVRAAQEVLDVGRMRGLRTFVGYVCMDQQIDAICSGLQTSVENAVVDTQKLLRNKDGVVVVDRFPIAVSPETRRRIAFLARDHDVLYETHIDESEAETDLHRRLYDGRSAIRVLMDDGVFKRDARVGLAHAIHTDQRDMDLVGDAISRNGCDVSIRACPSSNGMLGSHWRGGQYVRFPYEEWEKRGARITLGTDQGAGRNDNMFAEMLYEGARHPADLQPSPTKLLRWGILNGYESLRFSPDYLRITVGGAANFIVVKMAGDEGFYSVDDHHGKIQMTAARVIEGGQHAENVLVSYVDGRPVKMESGRW